MQSLGGTTTNWHQPYAEQWDLDVQREIPYNIILDVGYYGSRGVHQISQVDINQPLAGAYATNATIQNFPACTDPNNPPFGNGTCYAPGQQITSSTEGIVNIIRPYQGYGPIDVYEAIFSTNYNSLQTSLQKRFRAGSLIGINYTWAKSLTNRPRSARRQSACSAEHLQSRFRIRSVALRSPQCL